MPIWLRRFTFNKLKEHYDKQNEEIEKQQNILNNKGKNNISQPNISPPKSPTYISKAPKK